MSSDDYGIDEVPVISLRGAQGQITAASTTFDTVTIPESQVMDIYTVTVANNGTGTPLVKIFGDPSGDPVTAVMVPANDTRIIGDGRAPIGMLGENDSLAFSSSGTGQTITVQYKLREGSL